MSETGQILIGAVALIVVFILTRFGILWKTGSAARFVLEDLESQGAFDPVTAVELPYSQLNVFRIGMRDYRKKALEYLVSDGTVVKTQGGKYYTTVRKPPAGSAAHHPPESSNE